MTGFYFRESDCHGFPPESLVHQIPAAASLFGQRQNLRSSICDDDRIFIMGRQGTILGHDRPLIIHPCRHPALPALIIGSMAKVIPDL